MVFNRKCKLFLGKHWWKLRRPFRTRCWQLSVDKWLEYVCIISIFIFIHLCCYVPLIEVSCMKSKISGEASDKVCYKGLWYLHGCVYKSLHTFCSWTAIEKDTTIYGGSPTGKKLDFLWHEWDFPSLRIYPTIHLCLCFIQESN